MAKPEWACAPNPKPKTRKPDKKRPLRYASEKRRIRYADREHVRRTVIARDGYRCIAIYAGAPDRCASPDGNRQQLEVHEIKTRARGGSIYSTDNCIAVCQNHHDWVTGHPLEAHELGLVLWSWEPDLTEPFTPKAAR